MVNLFWRSEQKRESLSPHHLTFRVVRYTIRIENHVWLRGNGNIDHFGHCVHALWPQGIAGNRQTNWQGGQRLKETTEDLRQSVEPEINMITQELKSVEQDFESSIKEAEEQIKGATDEVTEPGDSRPA